MGGLSEKTIAILKVCTPLLKQQRETLGPVFYKFVDKNERLKGMFPTSDEGRKQQGIALSDALIAYTANCENVPSLLPLVESMGAKRVVKGVKPEDYPVVGGVLLDSLEEVLGKETFNADVKAGVAEGYSFLADIFIDLEKK